MFYYVFNSFEISKYGFCRNSSVVKLANKNTRSKKVEKINEIDLYYNIEAFNEENKLNKFSIKGINPKSYHNTNFVEQILVSNFLFKKYDVIIISDANIKDFNREKIKYFKYIIIEKLINNKKYYFKYDSDYKLIKD